MCLFLYSFNARVWLDRNACPIRFERSAVIHSRLQITPRQARTLRRPGLLSSLTLRRFYVLMLEQQVQEEYVVDEISPP